MCLPWIVYILEIYKDHSKLFYLMYLAPHIEIFCKQISELFLAHQELGNINFQIHTTKEEQSEYYIFGEKNSL